MTATVHAFVGATIATKIPNPLISLPLAFLSHFVCDKIPHWDVMTKKADKTPRRILVESMGDGFLSVLVCVVVILLFPAADPVNIALSAFAAQSPDWLEIPYTIFNLNIAASKLDYRFQKWLHDWWFNSRLAAPWGILTQVGVMAVFFLWAIN